MTSTFIETQFPPDVSYGSKGGSGFNTSVFETTAGFEQRNINWSKSKGEWDAAYGVRDKDTLDVVLQFFMAMQGRAYGFRWKDWADFQIINQQIGTGDGTTAAFQMVKIYSDPLQLQTFTRIINKPVASPVEGAMSILVDGAPSTPTTDYILDTTTGIITFQSGHIPASGKAIVVAYAEFDVPARFDVDRIDVNQSYFQAEEWQGIKIVETRLS